MKPQIEPVSHSGWPNCLRLSNGEIELIATTDVGPRIIHCGFVGGQNLFATFPDQLGHSGEAYWMGRGGHRLWVSPEIVPDTYALDNAPVKSTVKDGCAVLLGPVEQETLLRKEISIEITQSGEVSVVHRIENLGPKARRLAPWALTQMAPGGTAFASFPPRGTHNHQLQPTNPLAMWAYTDFSDERWQFTKNYLILKADPHISAPQKAGLFNEKTFAAYLLGTDLFTKRAEANPQRNHPDFHCSCELFTNADFLELETLGPLVDLAPDSSVYHIERWSLHRNVQFAALNDEEIDRVLGPLRS